MRLIQLSELIQLIQLSELRVCGRPGGVLLAGSCASGHPTSFDGPILNDLLTIWDQI